MTNVVLRRCRAERCADIGFYQQAAGTWVDVLDSSAAGCPVPVAGSFRTAEVRVE